jgi:hypothetical protein
VRPIIVWQRETLMAAAAIAALCLGACDRGDGSEKSATSSAARSSTSTPASQVCGTYSGRGCAPKSKRVDLDEPKFSNSTKIDNPLFPISKLQSVVLLGHVEGKPFRSETTLLPGARTIAWNGRRIKARTSQYTAYLDGRIVEVALDLYAQADDGSVWYLGEDVVDYKDGAVFTTEGTWRAGREGPGAMIMPGKPKVGDTFRTENIPGIVFEEVSVKSVGGTVRGPHGPVKGALVGSELHLDRTREEKIFAPGYGEFRTSGGGDLEALTLAVPKDALSGELPAELRALSTGASGMLGSVRAEDWEAAAAALRRMNVSWRSVRSDTKPPRMIADRVERAIRALTRGVKARSSAKAAQASIEVMQSALDLELRHRPQAEVDAARFDLWAQQLLVHAAARDRGGVTGDVATLEWIRDRFAHTVSPAGRREIDTRLRGLRTASDAGNLATAADHAARLAGRVRSLTGP